MSEHSTYATELPQPRTYSSLTGPYNARVSAALVKAQAEIHAAYKGGNNTFDKYKYSKLEDFWEVAKPVLAKHGLSLAIATIDTMTLEARQTKNGGIEHAVRVKVLATLRHESGEYLDFPGYGEGQDRADKAIYKAITGARKYVLAGVLAIPTTDDPEADEKVGLTGKGDKLASNGTAKQKVPKWSDEQIKEAGGYIGSLRELLIANGTDLLSADMRIKEFRALHKYDEPADAIDAMATWKNQLEGNQ